MPNHPPTLAVLRSTFRQSGRLDWIGTRPAWRAAMGSRSRVKLTADSGITGDRYSDGGRRQVTLIQAVHLPVIAALCGRDSIDPVLLRRNPVISDIDLQAWRDHRFFIDTALPEGSGLCHPCSRMQEVLGYGGYNAMRGHGGITTRVIAGAVIEIGDAVQIDNRN